MPSMEQSNGVKKELVFNGAIGGDNTPSMDVDQMCKVNSYVFLLGFGFV